MSLIKIISIPIVAIALGILVVSNFALVLPVVVFNQQTVALPMGVWLLLAIGLGFLLSSLLQGLLYLQRRPLVKRLRQLQTRLNNEEDVFTYSPPRPGGSKTINNVVANDLDDWETETVPVETMDWEDAVEPARPSSVRSGSNYDNSRSRRPLAEDDRPDRFDSPPDSRREEIQSREAVYDADFKLIQPPYKEPPEPEFDYPETEPEDLDLESESDFPPSARSVAEPSDSNYASESNEDDWGFDFDEEEEFEQRKRK